MATLKFYYHLEGRLFETLPEVEACQQHFKISKYEIIQSYKSFDAVLTSFERYREEGEDLQTSLLLAAHYYK